MRFAAAFRDRLRDIAPAGAAGKRGDLQAHFKICLCIGDTRDLTFSGCSCDAAAKRSVQALQGGMHQIYRRV